MVYCIVHLYNVLRFWGGDYLIFCLPLADVPINSAINKRQRCQDDLHFAGIPVLMVKAEHFKPGNHSRDLWYQLTLVKEDTLNAGERGRERERSKTKTVVDVVFRNVRAAIVVKREVS